MNLLWLILSCIFVTEKVWVNSAHIKGFSVGQPRIIGGEPANAGEFPWAAAIYKTTSDGNYFCGGALLNVDWVLTAAQCVDGAIVFTIILGTNKLQGDENEIRVATETYYSHPDYNPQTLENDIGLIKFRQSITLNMYTGTVALPFFTIGAGAIGRAVGWGQTSDSDSGLKNDLQWVNLDLLTNDECKIYYGDQIKDNMLCAAGQYNQGTCYGDIGGPMFVVYRNVDMHIGIASFISSNGCESTNPSGYTRTYSHIEWIRNHTNSESQDI